MSTSCPPDYETRDSKWYEVAGCCFGLSGRVQKYPCRIEARFFTGQFAGPQIHHQRKSRSRKISSGNRMMTVMFTSCHAVVVCDVIEIKEFRWCWRVTNGEAIADLLFAWLHIYRQASPLLFLNSDGCLVVEINLSLISSFNIVNLKDKLWLCVNCGHETDIHHWLEIKQCAYQLLLDSI